MRGSGVRALGMRTSGIAFLGTYYIRSIDNSRIGCVFDLI